MNRSRWNRLVRDGWLLALVALLLGVSAWVTSTAAERHTSVPELAEIKDADRLTQARLAFERSGVRILVDLLADGTGAWDPDPQALTAAKQTLRESYTEIEDLAGSDGRVGELATAVVDAIDRAAVDDPIGESVALYDAVDDVRWSTASLMPEAPFDALFELGFFVALPEQMLIETITALAEFNDAPVDPAVRDLYDEVLSVIDTDGGWLATDLTAPLTDSEWFDVDTARAGFPEVTDEVEQVYASSRLIETDTWMRERDGATPPPTEIDDLRAVSADVRAASAALIDPLVQLESSEAVASADSSYGTGQMLHRMALALAAAAVIALIAGVALMARRRRAERRLFDLALTDPLTGASSRHVLDTRIRPLVEAGRSPYSVVVVVDLDRFKMINDAFGHAVGDTVLREVAARLRAAGTSAADAAGGISEVVRMGGDEFLLTVHAPNIVPMDLLRAELDVARRRPMVMKVDGRSEVVVPGFSIGLAEVSGAGDLDALIAAADLDAYADKADRVGDRRVNERRLGDRRTMDSMTSVAEASEDLPHC